MTPKLNTELFIARSKKLYNNYYNYDKTIYTGINNDVIITCPIHGDITIRANCHVTGVGCKLCRKNNKTYSAHLKQVEVQKFVDLKKGIFQRLKNEYGLLADGSVKWNALKLFEDGHTERYL